jgi:hypothetical protein
MSLEIIIMNRNAARIKLLSIDIFLDNFIIRRLHKGNKRVFIANVFIPKMSFKMPTQIPKTRAHFNSKNRLEIKKMINRRSGFTPNTLM